MAKFAYNNTKNANTSHTFLQLNCSYHPHVSFKKNTNLHSQLKTTNKLSAELQKLMIVCQDNFHHAQEL